MKKLQKEVKNIKNQCFFACFACWWKDPGGLKRTDPTDPDPQHWEVLSNLSGRRQARTTFEIISIYSRPGSGGCGDSCYLQVCSPLQGAWGHTYLVPSKDDLWNHLYIYSRLGSGGCGDSWSPSSVFPSSGWLRSHLPSAKRRRPLKSSLYIPGFWA